jgi:purine-binding chemotaxis protein CheW
MDIFGKDPFDELGEDILGDSIWGAPQGEIKIPSPEQVQQTAQPAPQPQVIPPQQQIPIITPQVVQQLPYPPVYPFQPAQQPPYPQQPRQDVEKKKEGEEKKEEVKRRVGRKGEEIKKASYILNFKLGNELYGVDVENIREVVRAGKVTPVPNVHFHVLGIMNLRGRIIPVISLRRFFGMPDAESGRKTKILVIEDEEGRQTGVLVDDVSEVTTYYEDELEPITSVKFSGTKYARGILRKDDTPIVVIDIREIVSESTIM